MICFSFIIMYSRKTGYTLFSVGNAKIIEKSRKQRV